MTRSTGHDPRGRRPRRRTEYARAIAGCARLAPILLAVLACLGVVLGAGPTQAIPSPSEAPPRTTGEPATTDRVVSFTSADGRPRTVAFRIWYPTDGPVGPVPTILISHGGMGSINGVQGYSTLARAYASHGYVAVVLNHPISTNPRVHLLDRPRDVSSVLDALEDVTLPAVFRGTLSVANSGLLGHSYGAYTAHAIGGANFVQGQFRDPRVRAIVALSPQGFDQFGSSDSQHDLALRSERNSWQDVMIPAFNIHGAVEADGPVNDPTRAQDWRSFPFVRYRSREDKFLSVVAGADHPDFGPSGSRLPGLDRYIAVNTLLFFDLYLKRQEIDQCDIGQIDPPAGTVSYAGLVRCRHIFAPLAR